MGGAITAPAAALEGSWTNLRRSAVPGRLVRLNIAGVAIPAAVAVTWKEPTWELAVTKIPATPVPSVVTVVGPRNVTLGPVAGAVKVTDTPGMAFPRLSCTLTLSGVT